MLLARIRASRASSLYHLDIRYMVNASNNVTLCFHKLCKNMKNGKVPPSVAVYIVNMGMKSCVLPKPFISIKPFKEIVSSSVSGWIKKVLKLTNKNITVLKRHFTRSTSIYFQSELTRSVTLRCFNRCLWSNESTRQKSYKNQVISPGDNFQETLSKASQWCHFK